MWAPLPSRLPELQKVTLDDVKKFHDQFYGASHGVLAVLGPMDQGCGTESGRGTVGLLDISPRPTSR